MKGASLFDILSVLGMLVITAGAAWFAWYDWKSRKKEQHQGAAATTSGGTESVNIGRRWTWK